MKMLYLILAVCFAVSMTAAMAETGAVSPGTENPVESAVMQAGAVPPAVPEPGSIVVLATGLIGLASLLYRKR